MQIESSVRFGLTIRRFDRNLQTSLKPEVHYSSEEEKLRKIYEGIRKFDSLYYYDISLYKQTCTTEILESYNTMPGS